MKLSKMFNFKKRRTLRDLCITSIVLASMVSLPAHPYFDKLAPPSFADPIPMSRSTNDVDHGWLAELIGLPNPQQVKIITQHVLKIMNEETNQRCTSINVHLRMLMFQHFAIYQHMENAQDVYFNDKIAYQWAHVLAMILKESSGDSTSITDMSGHSISTYHSKTNLRQWREISNLTTQDRIQFNYQTNFGLTQMSADRLFDAFRLAKTQQYDSTYLEGREGIATPGKIVLNTAVAIRRLIWFYQDFSQGRTSESEARIPKQFINNPKYSARYKQGLNLALLYCGTRLMFRGKSLDSGMEKTEKLQNAMRSIAYCKLGNPQTGYGVNEVDEKCFAQWVTLCPALNIDIATLTPLSYFATRDALPVCEETFKRLINKKPADEYLIKNLKRMIKPVSNFLKYILLFPSDGKSPQ